ncbi:hypothetical protein CEP54_003453 [Fusarium duplospermum]|uniref:LysM domain-containing protein n=1 Tax=Fusarium duplospermum TaxID=1325734 RepID=A0A428QNQ7_9HYPO|nr:hypothetical protein CEP54_003453 [Fusarium duplospermum]
MVFSMAVKATAFFLTLPSIVNGMPVLLPPQLNISLPENEVVPHSEALNIAPGLEHLFLGPDVPHINDPSIVLGPDTQLTNSSAVPGDNSWIKGMLQRLGMGGSSTKPGKKHSKRYQGWFQQWYDFLNRFEADKVDTLPAEITLINATPYSWYRGHIHSYQMISWELNWPKLIEPGQTVRVTSSVEHMAPWDAGGEVVYHLEGVSKPASFEIRRRTPRNKDYVFKGDLPNEISVRYLENLSTTNTPKGTVKKLRWQDWPGTSQWILAGKEGDFISDDTGPGWMQENIDQIGKIPLRELAVPRSHHAGMYKLGEVFGFGSIYNTLTQYKDLTYQMKEGGVRVIDIRPFLNYGKKGYKVYESHGSIVGGKWHGGLGVSLEDMINQVNDFNDKYPGELIIWDIHPNQALVRHPDGLVEKMSEGHRAVMYKEFKRLRHRVQVPDHGDLTMWPLEKFVANQTSGVLIRAHRDWRKDESWPGGARGFVTEDSFPVHQIWANSADATGLVKATIKDLKERKTKRTSTLFFADWILTKKGFDNVLGTKFIAQMAVMAYKAMFYELWESLSRDRYPNWIATDGIQSSESKTFAMVINHCLAAGRCGKIKPSRKKRYGEKTGALEDELGFHPSLVWQDDIEAVIAQKEKEAKKKSG